MMERWQEFVNTLLSNRLCVGTLLPNSVNAGVLSMLGRLGGARELEDCYLCRKHFLDVL